MELSEVFSIYKGLWSAGILLSCSAFVGFISYGLSVSKPRIIGKGPLKLKLLKTCPILRERYWPTFWAFHRHLATVCRALLQRYPDLQYKREIVTLADGGEVALDWGIMKDLSQPESIRPSPSQQDLPVLLILPGLTGCSKNSYAMHLAQDGVIAGYRPVVFNQRGTGGIKLKTARIYCASNIEDLTEVVQYIRHQYSASIIVGVGVSLGGMILVQYQHRLGNRCDLAAVIACSVSWDLHSSRDSLEKRLFNRMVYSKTLAKGLKEMFKGHKSHLHHDELLKLPVKAELIEKARVVSDVDTHLIAPMFGYSSLDDYYNDSRNRDKVHRIKTPLVCIAAADDPFVPKESLPIEEFEANPHTVMVLTSHGGHFGFVEGIYPNDMTWMNRTIRQLLQAFKSIL